MDHSKFFNSKLIILEENQKISLRSTLNIFNILNITFKIAEIVEGAVSIPFILINSTWVSTSGWQGNLRCTSGQGSNEYGMRSFLVFKLTADEIGT